jgi:hypothetical protein
MGKVITKAKHLLNVLGIVLLLGVSAVSWTHGTMRHSYINALLNSVGDPPDTIISVQERSRVRVLFDTLKKLNLNDWALSHASRYVPEATFTGLKYLSISTYQRNVFYVYASFCVP